MNISDKSIKLSKNIFIITIFIVTETANFGILYMGIMNAKYHYHNFRFISASSLSLLSFLLASSSLPLSSADVYAPAYVDNIIFVIINNITTLVS